jgi:U3 small nucleolar RNA-associated protein 15
MTDPSQWRLPVRRVDPAAVRSSATDPLGAPWSKELTVERFQAKLFGGVGCVAYSPGAHFIAFTARSQSLVMRLPFRPAASIGGETGASDSNCVWNEQLPRPCFATRFRADDRLVVQALERRVVVRSTETAFERGFDGHTRDVRDALFLTNSIVASVGDDATVRLWSLTQTAEVAVAAGVHTDYVRSACVLSERQFATGGYDRRILVWDVRSDMRAPALALGASHPVEKVASLAEAGVAAAGDGGGSHLLFAAAADVVMMYDLRRASSSSSARPAQRQAAVGADDDAEDGEGIAAAPASVSRHGDAALLFSGSFHTKTVAALAVHRSAADGTITVLSGGLDKRIRVLRHEADGSLRAVASRRALGGVTALAVHPDGGQFAVGTSDGVCSAFDIAHDAPRGGGGGGGGGAARADAAAATDDATALGHEGPARADRGAASADGGAADRSALRETAAAVRKERAIASWLRRIHALLARYRYGLALKTALYAKYPDVIVTTLDELQRRCALHVAVSGHNDRTIVQLLRFVSGRVADPKLTNSCLTVMNRVLEIYAPVAAESEHFLRELLRCHHAMEELSADVEHIRASAAIMELLVDTASSF